jgi:hypothetical protein
MHLRIVHPAPCFREHSRRPGAWLNQVERWFGGITEKRIRLGSFKSLWSLEQAIQEYLDYNNQNPKPFVPTADADLICADFQDFIHECLTQDTSREIHCDPLSPSLTTAIIRIKLKIRPSRLYPVFPH